MKENTERISYVTFLQSLAVVLVIIGHCLPKPNLGDIYPYWAEFLHKFVYSFHMPLFFTIAGFLLANSFSKQSINLMSFKAFIQNKFKRIIVPYFAIGTLAYLLKVFIFNRFAYRPAQIGVIAYIKSMLVPWDNPNMYMWFLPTIFFIFILSYLVLNRSNYKNSNVFLWIAFSFIISFFANYTDVSFLNISGILNYLFYFFIGILIFSFKELFFKYLSENGIIIFVILLFFELQIIPSFRFHCFNHILSYLTAITGIILSFIIAYYCSSRNIKFLGGIIDGLYYQIYLLSWFFQCGTRVFYQMHLVNYPTVCIIMFISSFIFPILITAIIKKYIPGLKVFIGL